MTMTAATTLGTTTTTTFERIQNRNDKMTLQSHLDHDDFYDSLEQEEEEQDSVETESITLTNNNESDSSSSSDEEGEEEEIIHLHHSDTEEQQEEEEEELSDYQRMLRDAERGYKRMELKGESESDKDLIIYSLNESLQIHKEIVERIQNEKDDLEDQYELEMASKKEREQEERLKIAQEQQQAEEKLNKLEQLHQNLLQELENKKLEYKRMETRFHSHVKGVNKQDQDDLSNMTIQINQLLSQVSEFCASLSTSTDTKVDMIYDWWPTIEKERYKQALSNLDIQQTIALLLEKKIMEIFIQDIFNCSIHPGVSLNNSFQQIHHWVEKRNTSWASRMKQQITSFIVQQSNEEGDKIDLAKKDIKAKIFFFLKQLNAVQEEEKEEITKLVEMVFQLNLALKCCQEEYKIDILPIKEDQDLFDKNYMVRLGSKEEEDPVKIVISPPFVAKEKLNVIVPAKVYC